MASEDNPAGSGGPWGGESGKGGPKNPWGPPPKPPVGGGGREEPQRPGGAGGPAPDFDAFIRRSQQRIRQSLRQGGSPARHEGGFPWAYVVGGLAALWIVVTSVYTISPQDRGVVQRFGAYVGTTGPGTHLKLPLPIDTVTRVPVEAINTISVGASDSAENLILTGDQNLINMAYNVRYRINDPVKFLYELAAPEATVREVAESAMRAEVAQVSLNNAIGPQRAQIADAVRDRMQLLLNAYNSGIEVVGVDMRQNDPPQAVKEAFNLVSAAQSQAQRYQNDARTYAQQIVAKAQGETAVFNALYAQYKLAPEVTRRRLYYETMEDVLGRNPTTVIEGRGAMPYLPLPLPRAGIDAGGATSVGVAPQGGRR